MGTPGKDCEPEMEEQQGCARPLCARVPGSAQLSLYKVQAWGCHIRDHMVLTVSAIHNALASTRIPSLPLTPLGISRYPSLLPAF